MAVTLAVVLTAALGTIVWRLALVSLTLIAAAVRYTVVAVLLVVITAFFI